VIPITLAALSTELGGHLHGDGQDLDIDEVMTDSRVTVPVGSRALFVALPTERADGHDHIAAARASGACAALVRRVVPDAGLPQLLVPDTWQALSALGRHNLERSVARVVAITGSYGKTTTKDLTAAALGTALRVVASRASFNNELGVPLTMLQVEADTEVLVAEVGARSAGDLSLLAELLRPDIAVVTAVGPVHLETFGDEDGVAREKGRLVEGLRPGGIAVLNGDDPRVRAMRPTGDVLHVSATGGPGDLVARGVRLTPDGRVLASVTTPWGPTDLELPIPGRHHLVNALLALAVSGIEGIPPEQAATGIARARTSASRASLHRVAGITVLDDTYNASAPTVIGALTTLADLEIGGRRWAVLGEMLELGETSQDQHRAVGASCVDRVDELVVVGRAAEAIADGAVGAGLAPESVHRVADPGAARMLLLETGGLTVGDAVLLKASRGVGLDRLAASLLAEFAAREPEPGELRAPQDRVMLQ
jgi:UDP-N-acetylmuramoyl-tripeptide--D-alanyl-D-alanine ligase